MSYHEQLVHLPLALNVGLIVCKHLEPETQSRVWLGFAFQAGQTSSYEQKGSPLCRDASQDSPVVMHEHVHNILEAARVPRGKEAAADLVDGLAQLGQALVILTSIVPGPSRDRL